MSRPTTSFEDDYVSVLHLSESSSDEETVDMDELLQKEQEEVEDFDEDSDDEPDSEIEDED